MGEQAAITAQVFMVGRVQRGAGERVRTGRLRFPDHQGEVQLNVLVPQARECQLGAARCVVQVGDHVADFRRRQLRAQGL